MKLKTKTKLQILILLIAGTVFTTCDFDRNRDASNNSKALLLFFLGQTVTPTSVATVGMYCGSTASLTGAAGGYSTLKTLCQSVCGTTTAHVCHSKEILNTVQFAPSTLPNFIARYSTFVSSNPVGGGTIHDCDSWTVNTVASQGVGFNGSSGNMNMVTGSCSVSRPFACCDFKQINR